MIKETGLVIFIAWLVCSGLIMCIGLFTFYWCILRNRWITVAKNYRELEDE